MSKNQDNKTKELNEKNKETQNIFANLKQYKKKDKNTKKTDNLGDNIDNSTSEKDNINISNNIYMSLLENNENKDDYVAATHYFRKDQLKDLEQFSRKTKKLKSEFMRELMDLVFDELKKGLNENKRNNISKSTISNKSKVSNSHIVDDNKKASSDNPFGSLLEVSDSKDQYVRASHYFRQDQLNDLDKFVIKSGKSKNEFVRDALDLVFSQLKEVNN